MPFLYRFFVIAFATILSVLPAHAVLGPESFPAAFDELLKNKNLIKDIILLKGKSYQLELDDATKKYSFKFEKFQSITSQEGQIIKINKIQPLIVNA